MHSLLCYLFPGLLNVWFLKIATNIIGMTYVFFKKRKEERKSKCMSSQSNNSKQKCLISPLNIYLVPNTLLSLNICLEKKLYISHKLCV